MRHALARVKTVVLYDTSDGGAAIRLEMWAICVAWDLSRSNWLVTSLAPGKGEKMSKHTVAAGGVAELLTLFADLRRKAEARTGPSYPIITIQEAGLAGFWRHRLRHQGEGAGGHVGGPASTASGCG